MQLSLRRAWPAVVVALLVAAGAVRAVAHNRGQAAAAACPAGYALASHEADGGHDADAGSASTTCLNTKHPESLIELIRRQEALETVRSAPYDTVAPGAFANAVSQSKTLPKASKSTGTSGTWSIYGKGPLIVNDPRYSRVNGLGLVNNEGRVDSIKYDPVNNRMFIAKGTGGIWMSTDAGDSWKSIGDGLPSQIVGAVGWTSANGGTVVAVSGDPTYGSGGYTGFGAFYSTDLGTTWQKATGVPDGTLGFAIETDPSAPNKVYAATSKGLFRSTDGGKTFDKVLYRDENTGGIDVVIDPSNPRVVYAALWEQRMGPWENGVFTGPGSGVYKSSDGGTTWKQLTNGLPTAAEKLGRVGLEVCAADPKRLFAIVDAKNGGLYRSTDAGENWSLINKDERIWERGGDFNEVRADPKNPDVLYVANVVTWKSVDGGKSFQSFRGAPGGDDYHRVWINPNDTKVILSAASSPPVAPLPPSTAAPFPRQSSSRPASA